MTKITVTKNDIKQGIIGDPDNCPIANAVVRTFPGALCASVNTEEAHLVIGDIDSPKIHLHFGLSRAARRAVLKYDRTGKMKPFTFEAVIEG